MSWLTTIEAGSPCAGSGPGPLYRDAADDDLAVLATRAAVALTW